MKKSRHKKKIFYEIVYKICLNTQKSSNMPSFLKYAFICTTNVFL